MDLSKAFDCLPHDLILLKLEAYGLSEKSINLLNSYLSGRKQCVKVKNICSSFETMYWNLSGLAYIKLFANQYIIFLLSLSNFEITLFRS
jgi:hypothetical protein